MAGTNRRARALTGLILGVCAAGMALGALELEGAPDPTFGAGGLVLADFRESDDVVEDLALLSDGKIVVVGGGRLARFLPDGRVDSRFSAAGRLLTSLKLTVRRVAAQDDGKIVVAGTIRAGGATSACVVARFTTNGGIDGSFGTGGVTVLDFPELCSGAFDLAVGSDGRIVTVLGLVQPALPPRFSIATVRLDANGRQDPLFNGAGIVFESFTDLRFPSALAIQSDGKVVVGAEHLSGYALLRYAEDGTRDASLNGTGVLIDRVVTEDIGAAQRPEGIAVDDEGTVSVALSSDLLPRFTIARHRANGSRVQTFGIDGAATGPLGSAGSIAVQRDGRILVAGILAGERGGLGIVRFTLDGSPDATFAAEGVTGISVANARIDPGPTPLGIQRDGRIVAGATAHFDASEPPRDWLLVRLVGSVAATGE